MNKSDKILCEVMERCYPQYFFLGEKDGVGAMMGVQDARFLTCAFLNYIDGDGERAYPFIETALNYLEDSADDNQLNVVCNTLCKIVNDRAKNRKANGEGAK